MRVCAPDGAVREVDSRGRRYRSADGVYDMPPSEARRLIAAGGFAPSLTGQTSRRHGYSCVDCGFGSYFTICSRCGGTCRKEANRATQKTG